MTKLCLLRALAHHRYQPWQSYNGDNVALGNGIQHRNDANKIFLFDEVYPFRAAQEQAEKKKLSAFGTFAKFNPLNRPREDTVLLSRQEMRLEPFWHISAQRSVDYTCKALYQVPVHNPYAQSLSVDTNSFEVARQKDKGRIDFAAIEHCHRKLQYDRFIDGLQREIKPTVFESYVRKYKFSEYEQVDRPETLQPLVPLSAAMQIASATLNGEIVNAFEIQADSTMFERTHMYLRPVFAFEYRWASADKVGVIEVDGLTGEIIENGKWFADKLKGIMTRDMLLDIGADVMGNIIPGGSIAVKVIGRIAESGDNDTTQSLAFRNTASTT